MLASLSCCGSVFRWLAEGPRVAACAFLRSRAEAARASTAAYVCSLAVVLQIAPAALPAQARADAVPEQAVPEQAVPEQAVPEQAAPEQAVPEQAVPAASRPVEGGPYGALIEGALREYRAHRFHEARSLFAQAHAVLPNARSLRGLGLVEFELRNYVESAALLERALAEPERALRGALRSETEQLWQRAEGFVARFELHSEHALTVRVDGVQRERLQGEPLALAVGDHLLEFSSRGYVAERRVVQVRGGEREALQVALVPLDSVAGSRAEAPHASRFERAEGASQAAARADVSPVAAARSESSDEAPTTVFQLQPATPRHDDPRPLHKNKWMWTGVVVAAAAAAVGLGFGLTADRGRTRGPISAPPIASRSGP